MNWPSEMNLRVLFYWTITLAYTTLLDGYRYFAKLSFPRVILVCLKFVHWVLKPKNLLSITVNVLDASETSLFNGTKYVIWSFNSSLNWLFYVYVVNMWFGHGEVNFKYNGHNSNIWSKYIIYKQKQLIMTVSLTRISCLE